MARASVNIFGYSPPSSKAPKVNQDGYPAWDRPLEEQVIQLLVSNTFGQTFHSDADTLIEQTKATFEQMIAKDSAFFAKALVYARNHGFMRTSPILGLVKLFKRDTSSAKAIFDRIILTPNDLSDFTSILKAERGGEGGSSIKKTAGRWLVAHLNEYNVIKYGAEKPGGYSLKDLLQVYHPRVGTKKVPKKLPLFDYIMGRTEIDYSKINPDEEVSSIEMFELLKRAETDVQKIEAITLGRLPHEVATSFASSPQVWSSIVPNLPIFALVRNLATLERHGVLDTHRARIAKMLTDSNVISKSKILPFRFVEATKHVTTPWVKDCLSVALDLSFQNVPDISGKTAVMIDVSGSMMGHVSDKSGVTRVDLAATFGICLMKKAGLNGRLITFNTYVRNFEVLMSDSTVTQAKNLAATVGGGTDHSVAMMRLGHDKVDNIIYVTDE